MPCRDVGSVALLLFFSFLFSFLSSFLLALVFLFLSSFFILAVSNYQ